MNYNDQSVPGLDGVASAPVRFADLCLRGDFSGRDSEPIRSHQRVVHTDRGAGCVEFLGNLTEQRVFVVFDSGTRLFVPSGELSQGLPEAERDQ